MIHDPSSSDGAAPHGRGHAALSREEFAVRFEGAAPVLWTIAAGIVGHRGPAEDILQEACVIALGKLEQFDPGTSFSAWMGAVVRNVARNAARKEQRQATSALDPGTLGELLDERAGASGSRPSSWPPTAGVDDRGELTGDTGVFDDALYAGLASLRAVPRAALLLRTIHGLDYREIAAILGVPEGTAMSHVHRSRQALRQRLEADAERARIHALERGA
ncbi:MAG: RNA polymerase sigma factor [Planctomycetota bacterium]